MLWTRVIAHYGSHYYGLGMEEPGCFHLAWSQLATRPLVGPALSEYQ